MKCKDDLLVLIGAAIGGVVGYFAFFWVADQGFYGLVLPGGLLGLGAGIFKTQSRYIAILCGIAALVLGIYTRWKFGAWDEDASFVYFLAHLHKLTPVTLIMIALGTIVGFWIPFRRSQEANAAMRESIVDAKS